jgi:hypothetical protein
MGRRKRLDGPPTFGALPVGACFAFSLTAKAPTRQKVDPRRTISLPGGKRPMVVSDIDITVAPMACSTSLGRARQRRRR